MSTREMSVAACGGILLLIITTGCSSGTAAEPPPRPSSSTTTVAPPTSAPPATFTQTYGDVNSGVVRIDVQGCEGSGSGTGFLIAPDLIATVAHVVRGAATVRVTQDTRSTSAEVLGLDDTSDVALIRTPRPLSGHNFVFARGGPAVGDRVGVIGFPSGDTGLIDSSAGSKSFKEGSVNGLDRKADIEGQTRTSLVELDALARAGNSGSPVIRVTGDVVGLLSAGPANDDATKARLAVSSKVAAPLLDGWGAGQASVPAADCSGAVGPDGEKVTANDLPGSDPVEAAATLNLYFKSINQADYATAYAQFHPDSQVAGGDARFAEGVLTSKDTNIDYRTLSRSGRDLVVWVTFTSEQDGAHGPDGLVCARWSLDYTLRHSDDLWLIVKSAAHGPGPKFTACA